MRALLLLVLAGGCELDRPMKQVPGPRKPAHDPMPDVMSPLHQNLDVYVREYGTNEPLYGVTVELVQDPPCVHSHDQPCEPGPRRFTRTDDDGAAHFVLPPLEDWRVVRIAESGYLTECPGLQDDDWHHRLVIKSHETERDVYTCMLVPRSALKVRDRATAIRLAKANPDVASWLRVTRRAQLTSVELHGIRWEVWFATSYVGPSVMEARTGIMTGEEARGVTVDALDGHSFADVVIDPYSDYLPSDYVVPAP